MNVCRESSNDARQCLLSSLSKLDKMIHEGNISVLFNQLRLSDIYKMLNIIEKTIESAINEACVDLSDEDLSFVHSIAFQLLSARVLNEKTKYIDAFLVEYVNLLNNFNSIEGIYTLELSNTITTLLVVLGMKQSFMDIAIANNLITHIMIRLLHDRSDSNRLAVHYLKELKNIL